MDEHIYQLLCARGACQSRQQQADGDGGEEPARSDEMPVSLEFTMVVSLILVFSRYHRRSLIMILRPSKHPKNGGLGTGHFSGGKKDFLFVRLTFHPIEIALRIR
jgi:hypothetical protein